MDGRELLAFASNDYLGLANDPALVEAVRDAASRWGIGAGASHLICGHFAPHDALETELTTLGVACVRADYGTYSEWLFA